MLSMSIKLSVFRWQKPVKGKISGKVKASCSPFFKVLIENQKEYQDH